jgi:hypothetical protein
MSVLEVIGSLNRIVDITVNTVTPIPKPINLLGHISPLYDATKFLTDIIKQKDIGIPINKENHKLFLTISYLS